MFQNREEAGKKLAEALKKYAKNPEVVILALPRGGVVVGAETAKALGVPLDIVVPRKIGAPMNPEYAIGAITETGDVILNEYETASIDPEWLENEMEKEKEEAQRRLQRYRKRSPLELKNKIVILVDDGVATGYTMRAAVASVRARDPKKIIIAVPHGAADSLEELRNEADEVVALETPAFYSSVSALYEEFDQVTDEKVIDLISRFG